MRTKNGNLDKGKLSKNVNAVSSDLASIFFVMGASSHSASLYGVHPTWALC